MSNVVQFLEAMAPNSKPMSGDEFVTAVASAQLEPAAQKALLDRDATALNLALGGRATMLCFVAPAEDDDAKEGEVPEEEEAPEREESSRAA